MARMSRMDAAFLAMERPSQPAHLGAMMVFDPGPDGPLTYDDVKDTVAARLHLVTSAKRVVAEAPFGLARPSWATDRAFDLEFHVRSAGLGPEAGRPSWRRSSARPTGARWTGRGRSGSSGSSRGSPAGASRCTPRSTSPRSTTVPAPS